ncbi:MAG: trigger factor [Candidatus Marinimicrobia bacterium]|nr:trigger factor [Candidatus Neomarinimicrobiota bacterium]
MDIKLKEINSYEKEIMINLNWNEIEKDFEKAIRKFSKRIKLPGFRPGKIPRKVLMNQFQSAIEADFIESSLNNYYLQALKEKEMVPVNMGSVSDVDFDHGGHFKFKVTFEVEPQIKLPRMKKNLLKVEKTIYVCDDEDINLAIEEVRNGHAQVKTIEDGAQSGDFVVCDLQEIDTSGVPIIGKKLETRYVKVGQPPFDNENEKKLLGIKPKDSVKVMVPIDENNNLSNFELLVKNVERQILPELNDDFVKLVDPKSKDMLEYRDKVKENLDKAYDNRSEEALNQSLSDAMIEKINPEFPPSMAESYLGHIIEDISKNNKEMDKEKAKEIYKPMAERNLKWYLIRNAIIESQSFEISKDDISQEIEDRKEVNPDHAKDIDNYFKKPSNRSRLSDDLMEKKILAYLKEFAKIKEVKVATKDLRKQSEVKST